MSESNKEKMVFIFLFLVLLFACGCEAFNCNNKKVDPLHVQSCGPEAIQETLVRYYQIKGIKFKKEPITREEISQEIRGEGSPLRCLISFFSEAGRGITWPSEVVGFFENRGYKIKKIKNLDELFRSDIALVLIHEKNKISSYHWISYSEGKNIKSFFGKETVVDLIYLISK